LTACFLLVAYSKNHHSMREWRYEGRVARELLHQSWPLLLSGMAVMIYMRIDQIMIGEMLGDKDVGLFSAAVKIGEVWYFVPMAIASSLFPTIVESKKLGEPIYYARLQKFITIMTWMAISMAVVVTLAGDLIVDLLFGAAYTASATVLAIHIWAGVFVALGVASSGWFIVEGLQKLSFYRTLCGCITNVTLNLFLIPRYGIDGAAAATVASQGCAAFFFDLFNGKTRPIFWMKVRALNPLSVMSTEKSGR
jgi:O-antigen/teichoic acid export membrane protein